MRTTFRIPIGDWSGDGHGMVEWFTASSSNSLEDTREAYFSACGKLHPSLHPEEIMNSHDDDISGLVRETLECYGYDPDNFGPKEMAQYVCWFINKGDPSRGAFLEETDEMLPFYGMKKNRHIGFIGYGMFQ